MRFLTLLLLLCTLPCASDAQEYFIGGKLGYSFPTNIGPGGEKYGFKDLSDNGLLAGVTGKWFYNDALSLGADLSYQYQDGSNVWDVANQGGIDVSYQTLRLLLNGSYYFSTDEFRPYAGISFGAYYLINTMDFNSDNISNPSTAYTTKEWKPGIAPQFGFLVELSDKILLDCHLQMDLIQHMEPTVIFIPDYGNATQNSHKSQNQISLNIGLLFGL
ncbi:hypothetical protein [Carboxylicivirga sp. RSCT41]|uniref:hypothetical protein n=1 Tax=Carboxylicivirga agarovorans TaxID=3417570 RepID=UPI003D327CE5